jgi:hypothetical protein
MRGKSVATGPSAMTESALGGWEFRGAALRQPARVRSSVSDLSNNLTRRATMVVMLLCGVFIAPTSPAAEPTATIPSSSWTPPASPPSTTIATTTAAAPAIVHKLDSQVAPASCNDGGCQSRQNGGGDGCNGSCQGFANYNDQPCGSDFAWGCGPWPWRNGPGMCDDWLVGPRWDVKVDGLAMFRTGPNLSAITTQAAKDINDMPLTGGHQIPEVSNDFDWGGRRPNRRHGRNAALCRLLGRRGVRRNQ